MYVRTYVICFVLSWGSKTWHVYNKLAVNMWAHTSRHGCLGYSAMKQHFFCPDWLLCIYLSIYLSIYMPTYLYFSLRILYSVEQCGYASIYLQWQQFSRPWKVREIVQKNKAMISFWRGLLYSFAERRLWIILDRFSADGRGVDTGDNWSIESIESLVLNGQPF